MALMARQRAAAKAASEAATPHVLALFASDGFRDAIRGCCPEAAAMPAEKLLQRFRAEIRSAELPHGFPAVKDDVVTATPGSHFTVQIGEEYGFFLNGHQVVLAKANASMAAPAPKQPRATTLAAAAALAAVGGGPPPRPPPNEANLVEHEVFGCAEFANPDKPTWQEASDRMVYVAHNLRQVDSGSNPIYGNAAAVFSNSYVKDMVLIAAADTGLWDWACNKSYPGRLPLGMDCSAWDPQLIGTWDHFDHIILSNLGLWRLLNPFTKTRPSIYDEARELFERSPLAVGNYSSAPNMSFFTLMRYWETNILGNVRFPDGIRFLIGSFAQLFGTASGRRLQAFAGKFGWPLVWSAETLDPNISHVMVFNTTYNGSFNGRTLDPTVLSAPRLNASFSKTAPRDFEALWRTVAIGRDTAKPGQWRAWWAQLSTEQIPLEPVAATRCGGDVDGCVGVDMRSGACICKPQQHRQQRRQQQQRLEEVVV